MTPLLRPTCVHVSLKSIQCNIAAVRDLTLRRPLCAVVKANAYGHGLVGVGRALESLGVEWLAVALVEEGIELREAGIRTPILVLGMSLSGYRELVDFNLVPTLYRL